MTPQHYAKLVEKNAPKSRTALNCLGSLTANRKKKS